MCTLLDYSEAQLASDRALAEREGYPLRIVRADMTRPLPFPDGSFDLIVHPVSNCYIREVLPLWRECFRVLAPGGVLLSGLDTGMNFIVGEDERTVENALPYDPLAGGGSPEDLARLETAGDGVQFSHTAEEQLGGQLRAGFRLTDLCEDTNGSGYLAEKNIPSFWATRAVKPEE